MLRWAQHDKGENNTLPGFFGKLLVDGGAYSSQTRTSRSGSFT